MTKRIFTAVLLMCASIGVGCENETVFEPRPAPGPKPIQPFTTLAVSPNGVSIRQGHSDTAVATLKRSGGNIGTVNLTLDGVPSGVGYSVSNVQSAGLVTTATLKLYVGGSTIPNTYTLVVHGSDTGFPEATAAFTLTVESPCPATGVCEQWAANATASSEYTSTAWSAQRATGEPDAGGWDGCEDDGNAWASLESDGVDWLELVYARSVVPTEIRVHEMLGVSSIVKVEVRDAAGTYYTVYNAQPASKPCHRVLAVPVTGISAKVKVVRIGLDQRTLKAWNEIDAVQLIGQQAPVSTSFSGLYDLTAPLTHFDPAWGDWTGCRYTAVLSLQQSTRDAFNGTYSDLQFICPGESSDWQFTGFVTGSIALDGQVTVELIGGNHTWTTWYGRGKLVSGEIAGDFGCCGHISGTFIVKPRPAD